MQSDISTSRLNLKLVNLEGHSFMLALLNSKGWLEFIGDRNVHTTEEAVNYIDQIMKVPELYYWVVRIKGSNIPVGIISFIKRTYLEHFDIGFAFLPEFNGNGYAYEAAQAVLSMVSNLPGYYPVLATTMPQNVHSIKLLNKLGLHFERTIEVDDQELYVYSNASTV
jgi:RimJ/RimL family protein N-acetyltransferase